MDAVNAEVLLGSLSLRLGLVGAQVTQAFATRVSELGITHKHAGMLAIVESGRVRSQREVAEVLGVAPSLVVALVDRLVEMGAVRRVRDTVDRRVQLLELTPSGQELLARCVERVAGLDRDLQTLVGGPTCAALTSGLEGFVGEDGLPMRVSRELPGVATRG